MGVDDSALTLTIRGSFIMPVSSSGAIFSFLLPPTETVVPVIDVPVRILHSDLNSASSSPSIDCPKLLKSPTKVSVRVEIDL